MEPRTPLRAKTRALVPLVIAAVSLWAGPADAAVCEAEPTDMSMDYSDQVTCPITPGADTDTFRFSGIAGDRVLAEALFVSGSGFFPRIQLIAPDGTTLANAFNPARADEVLPQTGTYTVLISDENSSQAGEFAFTVSCLAGNCMPDSPVPAPGGEIACEPEPTDMFPHYGTRVTCDITPGADTDVYRFNALAGDRILAEALFLDGPGFFPRIQVIAPNGATLANSFNPARADLVIPETGIYTVIVSDENSAQPGAYAFTVSCLAGLCLPGISPNVILTLTGCTVCHAAEQFTVQAHWTNPGTSAVRVELKAGLRLPDGTAVNTLGNKHLEATFPAGLDVTANLLSFAWPAGLPPGTWTFEAVLLGPNLGETFAREVKTFRVEP